MIFKKIFTVGLLTFFMICSFSETTFPQIQDDPAFKEALKDIVPKRNSSKYVTKAEESVSEGNLELAISYYDKAIEANPDNARTYIMRGKVKQRLNDFNGAIGDYFKAIDMDQASQYNENSLNYTFALLKDAEAYFNIGQIKITNEDYSEAIRYLTLSIESKPTSHSYFYRGNAKYLSGLPEEAVADYNQAIKLNPDNRLIYLIRGLSLLEIDKTGEACRDFFEAIDSEREEEARKFISDHCT